MPHRLLPLAGSQVGDYGHVDAPAGLDAKFNRPYDCELSKDRNYLYVSDYGNNVIRRIKLSGSYSVDTFCPAKETGMLHVNPATGNLWFMAHEGTEDFWTARHHITRVTPSGNVRIVHTFTGEYWDDPLPDPAERFVRVKGWFTYIPPNNGRYYSAQWHVIDVRAGGDRLHVSDGAYGGLSGQMWSKRHPDTYFWLRAYQYPSEQGASLGRAQEFGAPYEYDITQSTSLEKIVGGPEVGANETFFGLSNGYILQGSFNADSAAPYISPSKEGSWLNLPRISATTLARDDLADVYYFPISYSVPKPAGDPPVVSTGVDTKGLGHSGIPYNTVGVGVPNSQLSIINWGANDG